MESTMPAQRLPGTTRLLRETASEAPGAGTDALEGLVWQRRVHLGVKKPEGVSLPTGRPTGPFSFPVMSQREWRGGRGSGPSVLRAGCQDPCTCLTVGPSWARLSPFVHQLLLLHPTRAPPAQGGAARGPQLGKEGSPGALRGARVQGRGRKRVPVGPGGGRVPPATA